MARFRVAVDVGGTFTDVFIFNEQTGETSVCKVLSVPLNPAEGIVAGMRKAEVPSEDIKLFAHGTTVGTNALITRRLPPTGMVTTKGFRDVLEIRRSTKPDLWDAYEGCSRAVYPPEGPDGGRGTNRLRRTGGALA